MGVMPSPTLTLRILLVVCALSVVSLLYIPMPVVAELAKTYHSDIATTSGIVSVFGFAYAAGFLIFGPLSDRYGRQQVIVPGLIILTAVTLAMQWVTSLPVLLLFRAVQGFTAATFTPTAIAYLSERGTTRQKRWSIAWMTTAFLSAGLLGQIYGETIASKWGLGMSLLPLTGVYLLTAWRLSVTPRDVRGSSGHPLLQTYRSAGKILLNAQLQRLYFIAFIILMCFVSFYMELDMHARLQLNSWATSSLSVRIFSLPAFLMTLFVALLIPKVGARRVVIAGLILAAAGLLLCVLGINYQLWVLMLGNVLFVGGISITIPGLIESISLEADPSLRGVAVAIYTFVLFLGASLGLTIAQMTLTLTAKSAFLVQVMLVVVALIYFLTGSKNSKPD